MKNQSDNNGGTAREKARMQEKTDVLVCSTGAREGRKPFKAPRLRYEAELVGETGVTESCAYSADCSTGNKH